MWSTNDNSCDCFEDCKIVVDCPHCCNHQTSDEDEEDRFEFLLASLLCSLVLALGRGSDSVSKDVSISKGSRTFTFCRVDVEKDLKTAVAQMFECNTFILQICRSLEALFFIWLLILLTFACLYSLQQYLHITPQSLFLVKVPCRYFSLSHFRKLNTVTTHAHSLTPFIEYVTFTPPAALLRKQGNA